MEVGLLPRTLWKEAMTRVSPCPVCKGTGEWLVPIEGLQGGTVRLEPGTCVECGGTGLQDDADAEAIPNRRQNFERE